MNTLYDIITNYGKLNLIHSKFIILNKYLPKTANNYQIITDQIWTESKLNNSNYFLKHNILEHMIYIVKLENSAICLGTFTSKKNYITKCENIVEFNKVRKSRYSSSLHENVYYMKNIETTKWKDLDIKEQLQTKIINENFICHIKEMSMSKKFRLINIDTFQIETDISIINDFITTTIVSL